MHRLPRWAPAWWAIGVAVSWGCETDLVVFEDAASDGGISDASFDGGRDAASTPLCEESDTPCDLEDACSVGRIRCLAGPVCTFATFAPATTACGDGLACDDDGECVSCGGRGEPCCESSCDEGFVCGAGGLCAACVDDAACRPAGVCRLGAQVCEGSVPSCVDDGPAPEGADCGLACGGVRCACDDEQACLPCGEPGQPCCGTVCASGAVCDRDRNECFACEAGASCDTGNACRVGVTSCASGAPVCLDVASRERGAACGDGLACDGDDACGACGGEGEPCCGSSCDAGFGCDTATRSCFACDEGSACVAENGCRTGTLDCSTAVARCVEDDDVARATTCGTDRACDGAGLCAACGAMGQPCCGTSCSEGVCDRDTGTCGACVDGVECAVADGCQTGTRTCSASESRCESLVDEAAGTTCGLGMACDGEGACVGCGGLGQPCCGTTCMEGVCDTGTGLCGDCPAGMVLVSGGAFDMGAPATDASAAANERPVHVVALRPFCLDPVEVSAADWAACETCGAAGRGAGCNDAVVGREDHPINCVTHAQAAAFCAARGARLPTEAEWELAARERGERLYPWGAEAPSCERANHASCGGATQPVRTAAAGATSTGLHDLAGNVAEWVSDFYAADFYADASARGDDPTGPTSGSARSVRGGAYDTIAAGLRGTARASADPDTSRATLGFRCAARVE